MKSLLLGAAYKSSYFNFFYFSRCEGEEMRWKWTMTNNHATIRFISSCILWHWAKCQTYPTPLISSINIIIISSSTTTTTNINNNTHIFLSCHKVVTSDATAVTDYSGHRWHHSERISGCSSWSLERQVFSCHQKLFHDRLYAYRGSTGRR